MKQKPNILVVDDEQIIRDLFVKILEGARYKVVTAQNGEEAIEKAKETHFDIVFLDIRMPGKDGVETLREIRKLSPRSQVFMMTAFEVPKQVEDALAEGASGSLFKPFDVGQVTEIVKKRTAPLSKLPVRVDGEMLLLDTDEIFYVKAIDNGAEIHTQKDALWARFTLSELEKRLGLPPFFRTHRSFVVNLDKVKKVAPLSRASVVLVMADEKQTPVLVSRARTPQVKRLLGM